MICNRPGCTAAIRWVRTERGKSMPLDAKPNPDGNVLITDGVAVVANDALRTEALARGRDLWMPHWATCTDPPPRKPKR